MTQNKQKKWTKKIVSVLLSVLLVSALALPVFAEDYASIARVHLADVLDLPEEQIVVDGSLMDLPHIGRQLWVGRYYTDGIARDVDDGIALVDEDRLPTDDKYPEDPDGAPTGMIAVDTATGDVLLDDEAQAILDSEWELERQEWEALQREAGCIEVGLYRLVRDAAADESFEVTLFPLYEETEAMAEAFRQLEDEYADILPIDDSVVRAGISEEATEGSEGSSGTDTSRTPVAVETASAVAVENEDGTVETIIVEQEPMDPETEALLAERAERLNAIRMDGYAASLTAMEALLQARGISFERDDDLPALRATLTAAEILSLKDSDVIGLLSDDTLVYALDSGMVEEMAKDQATSDDGAPVPRVAGTAGTNGTEATWIYWIAGGFLLAAGAAATVVVLRKRHAKESTQK